MIKVFQVGSLICQITPPLYHGSQNWQLSYSLTTWMFCWWQCQPSWLCEGSYESWLMQYTVYFRFTAAGRFLWNSSIILVMDDLLKKWFSTCSGVLPFPGTYILTVLSFILIGITCFLTFNFFFCRLIIHFWWSSVDLSDPSDPWLQLEQQSDNEQLSSEEWEFIHL